MKTELYRIDNFLLRIGLALLVLVGVLIMAFKPWTGRDPRPAEGAYLITQVHEGRLIERRDYVWGGLKTEAERMANLRGRYPEAVHIRPMPKMYFSFTREEKYFIAAALAPLAILLTGWFIRRRERHLHSIWRMLQHNVETSVPDMIANTQYTREQIQKAVLAINQRGLGMYAWRHDTDVIEDGRLASAYLHVERCDSCGGSVGLRVPASLREIPTCPYCHTAQSSDHLNELKRDIIRDLRAQPVAQTSSQQPMSIPLFIFMIILCWPAAIAYAVYKSSVANRLT